MPRIPGPRWVGGPVLIALLAAAAAPAADVLLIADSGDDRILAFDPADGALLNPDLITDPGSLAGVDLFNRPIEAVASGAGTILVSDQFSDLVLEFDFSGAFVRIFSNQGQRDTTLLNNVRGLDVSPNGDVLVANSGPTTALALSVDNVPRLAASDGALLDDFAFIRYGGLNGPFDVLTLADRILVANDERNNVLEFTPEGRFVGIFADAFLDFPQQLAPTTAGTILVANFSGGTLLEFSLEGELLGIEAPLGLSGYRGVAELDDGQILCTTSGGVFRFQRGAPTATQILAGNEFRFIQRVTLPTALGPDNLRDEIAVARELARDAQRRASASNAGNRSPAALAACERFGENAMPEPLRDDRSGRPSRRPLAGGTPTLPGETPILPGGTPTLPRSGRPPWRPTDAAPPLRALNDEPQILLIEDSGFFNQPGVTPGTFAALVPSNPADVTIVGHAGGYAWGGLDFRNDRAARFFGFENLTNSLRALDFGDGNTLVDSVGYFTSGACGFAFSPDGRRFYASSTAGSVFRIVEADALTAEVLSVWWYLTPATSLATVPEDIAIPYPPGQLWGLYTAALDFPRRELRLVQFELPSGQILSDRHVSGVPFEAEFETGLDWAPDGTLYAAVQGYRVLSLNPLVTEEVSSHLMTIDPVSATATDLGVIQAPQTWDVSGIAVLPPQVAAGDLDGDGDVDGDDALRLLDCLAGPDVTMPPAGCGPAAFAAADLDVDDDVDVADVGVLQALVVGP